MGYEPHVDQRHLAEIADMRRMQKLAETSAAREALATRALIAQLPRSEQRTPNRAQRRAASRRA